MHPYYHRQYGDAPHGGRRGAHSAACMQAEALCTGARTRAVQICHVYGLFHVKHKCPPGAVVCFSPRLWCARSALCWLRFCCRGCSTKAAPNTYRGSVLQPTSAASAPKKLTRSLLPAASIRRVQEDDLQSQHVSGSVEGQHRTSRPVMVGHGAGDQSVRLDSPGHGACTLPFGGFVDPWDACLGGLVRGPADTCGSPAPARVSWCSGIALHRMVFVVEGRGRPCGRVCGR